MVEIAAKNGVTTTAEEVDGFLKQMDNKCFCRSLNYILLSNKIGKIIQV